MKTPANLNIPDDIPFAEKLKYVEENTQRKQRESEENWKARVLSIMQVSVARWIIASMPSMKKADKMYDVKQGLNVINELAKAVDLPSLEPEPRSSSASTSLSRTAEQGLLS